MVDLRPAGNAGFYEEPNFIVRNFFFQFFHEFRPLRPWADEGKIALEDVYELRQFVEMR